MDESCSLPGETFIARPARWRGDNHNQGWQAAVAVNTLRVKKMLAYVTIRLLKAA
jgi:hypothetical protein